MSNALSKIKRSLLGLIFAAAVTPAYSYNDCTTEYFSCSPYPNFCYITNCFNSDTGAQTLYKAKYCDGWVHYINYETGDAWSNQQAPCSSSDGGGGGQPGGPWGDDPDYWTWMNIVN